MNLSIGFIPLATRFHPENLMFGENFSEKGGEVQPILPNPNLIVELKMSPLPLPVGN